MKISYCVTAKNEYDELRRLLDFLKENIREEDEVLIQLDYGYLEKIRNIMVDFDHYKWCSFPLNNDFASFKNNLFKEATGDFLFFLDADEIPNKNLTKLIPALIEHNPTIDLYWVPRINTVKGITIDHIQKWGWEINENGWINWPKDYQGRIVRNIPSIRWKNSVHEVLEGQKQFTMLPASENFSLYHPKTIERQEKQNEFYKKFNN